MARSITVALELDDSGFKRGIKQSQSQADGLKSSIGGVSNALKGFVAAAAGGFAIKGIVETTAKMQDLEGAFNTLFASQEQASAKFDEVGQLATKLGTDADTMREAFVLLKANGIEPTTEMLTAFVDMSKNSTEQLGALEAAAVVFSRSINEGAVSLEELDKIADRGVPVYRMLGEQLGITRGELLEFSKEGDNTKKILDALITSFQQEFGGTAARELETISSQMFVLQNVTDEAKKAIGEGFAPALANLTTELAAAIQANQDLLAEMGKLIGEGLSWMLNNLDTIVVGVKAFVAAWATFKIAGLVTAMASLRTAILAVNAALLANPITAIATALAAAAVLIVTNWETVKSFFETLWQNIMDYGQLAALNIELYWEQLRQWFLNTFTTALQAVSDAFYVVSREAQAAFAGVKAAAEDPLDAFDAYKEAAEEVRTALDEQRASQLTVADSAAEAADRIAETEAEIAALENAIENRAKQSTEEQAEALDAISPAAEEAADSCQMFKTKIEQLETALNDTKKETDKLTDSTDELTKAQERAQRQAERILSQTEGALAKEKERLENEIELLDYFGEEREVKKAINQLEEERARAIARINALEDYPQKEADLKRVNEQYDEAVKKTEELTRAHYEASRSFEQGFKEAYNKFKEDSTNAATLASDLFTTAAQDWRNAWVEASETGDLSFKTLIDNMKKRIVMFLADAAFIKLTEALADAFGINIGGKTAGSGGGGGSSSGGGSSGGGLGGLIDKGVDFVKGLFGFADGGYVAGNKSVIVGERGPEIFTPASSGSIIPNFAGMAGGGTQVTYNINAVDSASFVEMLSEQPEIIHSLVMDQDSRMFSRRL